MASISESSKVEGIAGYSPEGLTNGDKSDLLLELFNSVRFGIKNQVSMLLKTYPELIDLTDNKGFSCVHWAAKKGDTEMLQILADSGASLNQPTISESKMQPIHWAASDGKISSLAFLIEKRQDINAQDANGCTPVVIAAQHNQLHCVVYLIKNGADTTLRDSNGDTVLHWAAYKGFMRIVGVITYLLPHELDSEDTFGQTPLHLAALRGNTEVVQYLISDCGADTTKRDRNGLNPLELSVKKNQIKTEWSIRRLTHSGPLAVFLSLSRKRLMESKVLIYLFFGSTDKEIAAWPWRIVFLSNFSGSLVSFYLSMNESLSELSLLHSVTVIVQVLWWIAFICCLWKSPTSVRDGVEYPRRSKAFFNTKNDNYSSRSNSSDSGNVIGNSHSINVDTPPLDDLNLLEVATYSSVLDAMAISTNDEDSLPNLCHSCHVVRPLRSKHCKILRKCIHRFDHFCPFVGNTLGHDNYKYFVALLCMHVIAGTIWQLTAIILSYRVRISWLMTLFMFYSGLWMLLILSLLNYHTYLLSVNLTTNEHINKGKYIYFKDQYNDFDNPFNLGSPFLNILDGLFPSKKLFFSRSDVLKNNDLKHNCTSKACNHSGKAKEKEEAMEDV